MLNLFPAFLRRGWSKLLLVSLGLLAPNFAQAANLLENPDFENGLKGWIATPPDTNAFQVVPEAASIGKTGLLVKATPAAANLSTAQFVATPQHIYRFTAWVRYHEGKPAEIALEFRDKDGKVLPPINYPGYWPAYSPKPDGAFEQATLQATAPDGTVSVSINIKAPRTTDPASTDVDDCSFSEVSVDEAKRAPLPPPLPDSEIQTLLADIKANPTRGQPPPKIVLKLDDFAIGWAKGPMPQVHHHWLRIGKFAEDRKIKVGIGVVAKGLETASPEVFDWMKKMHETGLVEFWLHGYDHAPWTGPDGKEMPEGRGRSAEEQTQRQATCQKIAQEKLGFQFVSFGPTGSGPPPGIDEAMLQGLQNDPYMKDIMYPSPQDEMGKQLEAKGKVTVLSRVWCVNIEAAVGHPRFDVFLQGYAHNRGRDYFILQGHPPLWGWDDTDKNQTYGDFLKIVDFLQSQGAVFMTPSECAAAVKGESK